MSIQCPSVGDDLRFYHEPCERAACTWWKAERCSAVDTVPIGRLRRRKRCALAASCRWALQAPNGVCPPMTLGEVCQHQGGTFNTFQLEPEGDPSIR